MKAKMTQDKYEQQITISMFYQQIRVVSNVDLSNVLGNIIYCHQNHVQIILNQLKPFARNGETYWERYQCRVENVLIRTAINHKNAG